MEAPLPSSQPQLHLARHQPSLLRALADLGQPLRRPVPQLLPGLIGRDSR